MCALCAVVAAAILILIQQCRGTQRNVVCAADGVSRMYAYGGVRCRFEVPGWWAAAFRVVGDREV